MIGKRGDAGMPLGFIMTAVVAAVVFGFVLFLIGTKLEGSGGIIQSVKNILPDFGGEMPAASSEGLIAIELTDRNIPLRYYTGTSWAGFQKDASTVQIANVLVQIDEARSALMGFYFKSDRKASAIIPMTESFKQLSWSLPIYWNTGQDYNYFSKSFKFDESGLYVNVVDGLVSRSLGVYRTDLFLRQDGTFFIAANDKVRRAKGDELARYAPYLPRIIEWRDNILQGNKCEKRINIGGKLYSARIINQRNRIFLAVELSRPAEGDEPWADCAETNDAQNEIVHAPMGISFDSGGVTHNYEWKLVGNEWKWVFQESSGKDTYADFALVDGAEKSFYNGLRAIASRLNTARNGYLGTGVGGSLSEIISATFGPRIPEGQAESLFAENLILAKAIDNRLRVVSVDAFTDYLTAQYYLYARGESLTPLTSNAQIMISFSPVVRQEIYPFALWQEPLFSSKVNGVLWGKPYGACLQWYVLTKHDNYAPASFSNAEEFKMNREQQGSFGRGLAFAIQALDREGLHDYQDVLLYSATQNEKNEIVAGPPVQLVSNFDGEVDNEEEQNALAEKAFELYMNGRQTSSSEEPARDYVGEAYVSIKGVTLFYSDNLKTQQIGREERIATYSADNGWQFSINLYQNEAPVDYYITPASRKLNPFSTGGNYGLGDGLSDVLNVVARSSSARWDNRKEAGPDGQVYFDDGTVSVFVGHDDALKDISDYVVKIFSFDEQRDTSTNEEIAAMRVRDGIAVERVQMFYECAREGERS